jgi:hypothetical protein
MSRPLECGGVLERRKYHDSIIIELVRALNGLKLAPTKADSLFSYFVEGPVYFMSKPYRLVIVLERGKKYIGVINAFRVKEK